MSDKYIQKYCPKIYVGKNKIKFPVDIIRATKTTTFFKTLLDTTEPTLEELSNTTLLGEYDIQEDSEDFLYVLSLINHGDDERDLSEFHYEELLNIELYCKYFGIEGTIYKRIDDALYKMYRDKCNIPDHLHGLKDRMENRLKEEIKTKVRRFFDCPIFHGLFFPRFKDISGFFKNEKVLQVAEEEKKDFKKEVKVKLDEWLIYNRNASNYPYDTTQNHSIRTKILRFMHENRMGGTW
jgi:hypothetical protein